MGLLSHMEAIRARDLALQAPGNAAAAGQRKKIADYHRFSERTALKQSAVLVPFGRRFFMRYEHGFDAVSIFKSVSSVDFWNGTVPQNQQWHTFAGQDLEPFYQLFSNEVVHRLATVHVKSFVVLADAPIQAIMIATDDTIDRDLIDENMSDLADFIAADISNDATFFSAPIFSSIPVLDCGKVFTVSTREAVAEIADMLSVDVETLDILFPVLFSEANNRIRRLLSSSDFAFPDNDFNITLLFPRASSLDADLLQFQLQKFFAPLFGESSSKIFVEPVQS